MKVFKQLSIALLTGFAAANLSAQTNLVTNGSFETVNGAYTVAGNAQLLQFSGSGGSNSSFLPGWTVGGSAVASGYTSDFWTTANVGAFGTPPDGTHYLYMSSGAGGTNWLSQTVSGLTVGNTYQVSYWQSATAGYGTTPSWDVTLGGSTFNGPAITSYGNFQQVTTTFVATASSELLKFNQVGIGAPQYVALDGISLTQVATVPEPSAALLVGAAGFAILVRRRRSARA